MAQKRTASVAALDNFGEGVKMQKLDRNISKPLMEKRRRERINKSLGELKNILLEALKRDASTCSKLEKADILEMTVKYLQTTKAMTGQYPNPYGQQHQHLQHQSGYKSGMETSIRVIRENPALTEDQKNSLINQITNSNANTSTPVRSSQTQHNIPAGHNAFTPQTSIVNPMINPQMQALYAAQVLRQRQQWLNQQYMQAAHIPTSTISPHSPVSSSTIKMEKTSDSLNITSATETSDYEAESVGSVGSGEGAIFRPW